MNSRTIRTMSIGVLTAGVVSYQCLGRRACLTWGATREEAERTVAGDDLLMNPDIVTTRAVNIDAPPSAIWPWLMQMGSGKGGVYTYDWIENLFGLHMHSARDVLPQFQDREVGDVEQLGTHGPRLRVAILEFERVFVLHSEDGNWVWAFGLYSSGESSTRLISRNRIAIPGDSFLRRGFYSVVMEPGSLVMERKMLLGIKERAEALAQGRDGRRVTILKPRHPNESWATRVPSAGYPT